VSKNEGITLGDFAKELGAELSGNTEKIVVGLNTLRAASNDEVSFLSKDLYVKDLKKTKACAVIISPDKADLAPCDTILAEDPYLLYAKATHIFMNLKKNKRKSGISNLSDIHDSAKISPTAYIGPFCKIGKDVEIGEEVILGSGVVINNSTKIGKKTVIYANSTIYDSVSIGSNCIIHSGTVIGSDGLGFVRDGENWVKIEHLGKVHIGDTVEIGANCSIDRGSVGDTIIENQVKLDNQVHVAHNVNIGRATVIAANTAIAGSTVIGKNCTVSGGCGIIDNLKITDSVHITALSLVTKSITKPGTYTSGTTLMDHGLWKKNAVAFKRLKDIIKK